MQIGIDGRHLSKANPAGVSKYVSELAAEVAATENVELVVLGCSDLPPNLADCSGLETSPQAPPRTSGPVAHLWNQVVLPRLVSAHEVDLLHVPAGVPPIVCPVPTVTTIHDISPVVHPEWFSRGYATYYRAMIPLSIRASDRVIAVSKFTRDELTDRYRAAKGKTIVVHNGVSPPEPGLQPVSNLNPGQFFLFVGSHNPRKNITGLLHGYEVYRSETAKPLDLVLAGPDRDIFADVDLPEISGVRTLGYISEESLGWLYRNAVSLVYPSLYEGFGFPIVEAMSVGTSVITSDRGAMCEVAGDAALLVDPEDPEDIARGLQQITRSDLEFRERGRYRAADFDWEIAAEETIEVYREVLR